MKFVTLTATEYDAFARKHPCRNFLNSVAAFSLKQQSGWECEFVGVKENDTLVAACGLCYVPMMKSHVYAYAQRGFLIDYNDTNLLSYFVEELRAYLQAKKVVYLKIDPYLSYQERDKNGDVVENGVHHRESVDHLKALGFEHKGFATGFDADSQCRFMMVLDLVGQSEESLLKNMDQLRRRCIHKSEKQGVKVRLLKESELPFFKEMMNATAKRKQFHDMSYETYQRQIRTFGADNAQMYLSYVDTKAYLENVLEERKQEEAQLLTLQERKVNAPENKKVLRKIKEAEEKVAALAKKEREVHALQQDEGDIVPLSVAYFVTYEDEVVYVSGGSRIEMSKFNGPYAIQWHKIKEALHSGKSCYNFYGTSGDFTKDAEDYGVFEYKRGFNAKAVELVGDFILPIHKGAYKRYTVLQSVKRKIKR